MILLRTLRRCVFVGALASVLAGTAAADDIGPDVARKLLSEGRIRPLAEILDIVKAQVPGDMVEIELEIEHGTYVYDVKLITPGGRVKEVEVDAATGKILEIEDDD